MADTAYDADHLRQAIAAKGALAVIPNNPSRALKYPLDKHLYAQRHLVECCFSKLKQFRRVATRFEKTLAITEPSSLSPQSSYGCDKCPHLLADELDADRLAAAPDHFAGAPGPGIARKRQPQFGGQRVGIVDRDLRPGRRHVLHHALARRKPAIERNPPGLAQ